MHLHECLIMICTLNFFYDTFIDNCCKGYVKKKKTCAKELKYTTQKDTQENNIIVNIDQKFLFSVQIIKYKSLEFQQKFQNLAPNETKAEGWTKNV